MDRSCTPPLLRCNEVSQQTAAMAESDRFAMAARSRLWPRKQKYRCAAITVVDGSELHSANRRPPQPEQRTFYCKLAEPVKLPFDALPVPWLLAQLSRLTPKCKTFDAKIKIGLCNPSGSFG